MTPDLIAERAWLKARQFVANVRQQGQPVQVPIRIEDDRLNFHVFGTLALLFGLGSAAIFLSEGLSAIFFQTVAVCAICCVLAIRAERQSVVFDADYVRLNRMFVSSLHKYSEIVDVRWSRASLTGFNHGVIGVAIVFPRSLLKKPAFPVSLKQK